MPDSPDSLNPVRDLAHEQMLPTTMHGTRPLVTILDTRHGADGTACDDDRGLMARLGEKIVDYLRKFAL
jgi:hypothetical protein